jgi:thiamine-monophosphate kinase
MEKRTEIGEIGGEFGLINRIASKVQIYHPETLTGIGDDAAVLAENQELTVVSTDLLLEGVHFDLSYTPIRHLGYKAVAINISDIAAMNAIPKQITVSIALSNRFSVEAIDDLYEGIRAACENYQVDLVGGDTSASRSGLVISITAIGSVSKDKIVRRNTAQKGDIICVTGDLGGAFIGLQCLEREKSVFLANPDMQPQLEGKDYVVSRQLKPEARMDVIHDLRAAGVVPTSMIDISDGLAPELIHICKDSGVGAVIFEDKMPIHDQTFLAATDLNFSPMTAALNGGEDYELLFTVKQEDYDKVKNISDLNLIGYIDSEVGKVRMKMKSETVVDITAPGL